MKKGWKIFWTVIISLTGAGVVFCIIALCLGVTFSQFEKAYPNGIGIIRKDYVSFEEDWDDDDDDDDHGHECCHHHHDHDDDDDDDEHEHHHHHHDGECCCGHHHHHHDHDADEVFTSWGHETAHKYSHDELESILTTLDSGEYGAVLRAKGIVDGGDTWYEFDMVPGEHEIRTCGPDVTGKVCVIGSQLKEHEVEELFHA